MKKGILKGILIVVCLLIAGTAFASAKPQRKSIAEDNKQSKSIKQNVDIKKVKKYIKARYEVLDKYYGKPESELPEYIEKLRETDSNFKLSDWEYLEVMKIIADEVDFENFMAWYTIGPNYSRKKVLKLRVFDWAYSVPLERNKDEMTREELAINILLPFIQNSTAYVKGRWVSKLGRISREIKNKQLELSIANRNKISDELIGIFSDKKELLGVRGNAVSAWISCEKREEVILSEVDRLATEYDSRLFKRKGYDLWDFGYNSPLICSKMFSVLENRDKYDENILIGAIEFFQRSTLKLRTEEDIKRVRKFHRLLENIREDKYGQKVKDLIDEENRYKKETEERIKVLKKNLESGMKK